jgi:hypothetical protein
LHKTPDQDSTDRFSRPSKAQIKPFIGAGFIVTTHFVEVPLTVLMLKRISMRKGVLMISLLCIKVEFYFTDPEKGFSATISRHKQRLVHKFVSDVPKQGFIAIEFKTTDQATQMLTGKRTIIIFFFFL